jgi:peptide chain release factor 3
VEEGAIQLFLPIAGNEIILGAVGVLQFDVTMERLKAEYGVDAAYEPANYAAARWIRCEDKKKLDAFKKSCQANLAQDVRGDLVYLAASLWRLNYETEQWPEITFLKTREYQ